MVARVPGAHDRARDGGSSYGTHKQGPRPRPRDLSNGRVARRLAVAAVALVGLTSAAATSIAASPARPPARPPPPRVADRFLAPAAAGADGWQTATPAAAGMDPTTLDQARTYAFAESSTPRAWWWCAAALVAEWYAPGEGPDSWAASWSVAKSFTTALIGIASSQGQIPSIDEPLDLFPEWAGTRTRTSRSDVLHMASGLAWDEDYDPAEVRNSDIIQMGLAADEPPMPGRPLAHTPGSHCYYSSGDAMLLSGVLPQATGMSADEYAQQVLFGPLGMRQVEGGRTPQATRSPTAARHDQPRLRPVRPAVPERRQLEREQVVPPSWVEDSINVFAPRGHTATVVARLVGEPLPVVRLAARRGGPRLRRAVHLRDPQPGPGGGAQRRLRQERLSAGGRPEPLLDLPAPRPRSRPGDRPPDNWDDGTSSARSSSR